jgi:hypothetical protein
MFRVAMFVVVLIIGCGKGSHERGQSGSGQSGSGQSGSNQIVEPAAPTSRITAFWTWFVQHAAELEKEPDIQKCMERISDETAKIDPGLIGEVALEGKTRQLVLTADGKRELFPLVKATFDARPAHIEGWSVIAFRPRDNRTQGMTIEIGGQKVDAKLVKFEAAPSGHKLDVVVYIPHFTTMEEMGTIGFLLLDHTVGEYDMETKIGGVDFMSLDKAPRTAKPLTELPAQVDALN